MIASVDPFWGSAVAAVPTTIAAATGLYFALRSNRKTRAATEDLHSDMRTNHGKRPGEYLEMIGELVEWASVHVDEENEDRIQRGLPPLTRPKVS